MAGIEKRIQSEAQAAIRVTNNDLVCKDCLFRLPDDVIMGNTSKCEKFPVCKPNAVLLGGECDEHFKE